MLSWMQIKYFWDHMFWKVLSLVTGSLTILSITLTKLPFSPEHSDLYRHSCQLAHFNGVFNGVLLHWVPTFPINQLDRGWWWWWWSRFIH